MARNRKQRSLPPRVDKMPQSVVPEQSPVPVALEALSLRIETTHQLIGALESRLATVLSVPPAATGKANTQPEPYSLAAKIANESLRVEDIGNRLIDLIDRLEL